MKNKVQNSVYVALGNLCPGKAASGLAVVLTLSGGSAQDDSGGLWGQSSSHPLPVLSLPASSGQQRYLPPRIAGRIR